MDRPRLNKQPPTGRSRRVALWRGLVGQVTADMFMQVLIELVRRLPQQAGYMQLILLGVAKS